MSSRHSTPGRWISVLGGLVVTVIFSGFFMQDEGREQQPDHARKPIPTPEEIRKLPPDGGPDYNRLIFEKSPYLLQHAANPVDWFPWGKEAFEKARRENKPVFLSIGYSTCHWCHVMERESFEDEEVAALLNKHFVAVKVDREEREDVDNVYMSVCMAMTGSGGWPLTIIMTPDKKPFFAGTYFPKEGRFGRPGLMDILRRVAELWDKDRGSLLRHADRITEAVRSDVEPPDPARLGPATLDLALEQFRDRYDSEYGGFGSAPKFPAPHQISLLLRLWKRTGKKEAREMALKTLRAMRLGGLFDHVGFGFHRYSTDREWLLPHFEKMLYDQAMLMIAYAEAYQATRDEFFARTVREIATYVLRDMTSPDGGFYSAEDADSEGEEGKFYLWTEREWVEILGEEDGRRFSRLFGFEDGGNFFDQATGRKTGTNIPHLDEPLEGGSAAQWEAARKKLFEVRDKRVRPGKDTKVLTSWNGLMIAALAKAARILDEPRYAKAAARAAGFVLKNLRRKDGRLMRRFREGHVAYPGYLDDYAFFVWGLIELYETLFDPACLETALEISEEMLQLFGDPDCGGLFFSGKDGEKLFVRRKEIYDGAIPSGNSVAMLSLLRLARLTGREELEKRAEKIMKAFSGELARAPMAYAQSMIALDFALGPTREIVIAGSPEAEDTKQMLRSLRSRFIPGKVVLVVSGDEAARARMARIAPYVKDLTSLDGKATAYVCENHACRLPTTDVRQFEKLLEEK